MAVRRRLVRGVGAVGLAVGVAAVSVARLLRVRIATVVILVVAVVMRLPEYKTWFVLPNHPSRPSIFTEKILFYQLPTELPRRGLERVELANLHLFGSYKKHE